MELYIDSRYLYKTSLVDGSANSALATGHSAAVGRQYELQGTRTGRAAVCRQR